MNNVLARARLGYAMISNAVTAMFLVTIVIIGIDIVLDVLTSYYPNKFLKLARISKIVNKIFFICSLGTVSGLMVKAIFAIIIKVMS